MYELAVQNFLMDVGSNDPVWLQTDGSDRWHRRTGAVQKQWNRAHHLVASFLCAFLAPWFSTS